MKSSAALVGDYKKQRAVQWLRLTGMNKKTNQ